MPFTMWQKHYFVCEPTTINSLEVVGKGQEMVPNLI